ncbi:MAG: STAS domain-containing protein [Gammaproteobacteria bacterium]|nr:STAS domain-containing protein [Gammaproteobacteria bacterium]
MRIDIKWRQEGDIAIAFILGRIDSASSDRFQALMEEGLSSGPRSLLMDFERVSYISSAGLRVCLVLAKRLRGTGQALAMCSLSDVNREIVAVSGFDKLIMVHEDPESAIAAMRS